MIFHRQNSRRKYATILLLFALIITPILTLVQIQPVHAETVLTQKWSRSGFGSNWEGGLVIGDVTGDGSEDIVVAGGSTIYVLNGANGNTIARYTNSRIYSYCQPQLYDVDGDGVLDILVPLYYTPGLSAVKYTGSSTLTLMWTANIQGSSGSGSVMAKPVAADIDGDGHLDIFIASQDVAPAGGYDGTISRLDYQGHIVAQNFAWRACSGGLSLADTDNDGVFEIYQGDRQIYYGDGNYGKGCRSFWADNLTERWSRLDFLSSSQAPVLADVNGDGTLEVLCGMYREMNILNSTNGAMIQKWTSNVMSVHYGFTVYDIDGDGHLELLCSDGDHDDDAYSDVFDLVTGRLDAELSLAGGDWKWSPVVADISPSSPGMEIICAPNGTTLNGWRGVLMIYDSNFNSIQNVTTSLSTQLGYPVVQDIDGDGNLEVVVGASSGSVYAFDTSAPKPSQRIRSEVTYYGEKRTGVAQYEIPPWGENYWTAPVVQPVYPSEDLLNVPVSTTQLSFSMREHQGQPVNYSVTTSPNIGGASGSSVGNTYNWQTYDIALTPESLNYNTAYTWKVTATDGTYSTVKTYHFRTEYAPTTDNNPPTQTTPSLFSQNGQNLPASTFVCSNQSTSDLNGDGVTNIYSWSVNNQPVANLLLPFDTMSQTTTKDYSGYGNNGNVIGATWTPNGIVGGAYSFDGQNDAIIVSDGGKGYYNNKTSRDNNPELGGNGLWNEITVEAWIYLRSTNTGSRIVAKLPSYELGFQSGYNNRLVASVWPKTGVISTDDNQASADRAQTVTYSANLQLNRWYHIAFTYKSGDGICLYLNGAQVAQKSGITGPLEDSLGEPIYIGRLVQPFNGLIDEVKLYSNALSSAQISSSYSESRNGLSSSSSLVPASFGAVDGGTLRCDVTPSDGKSDGQTTTSNAIIMSNIPVYNLEIGTSGSGITNPASGTYQYQQNTDVEVAATADEGWTFDHWMLNGTNAGSANPYSVTMNDNYDLVAVFVEIPPPVQYNLHVEVSGTGTTNATGDTLHDQGASVAVEATADSGWQFSYWLLNDTNAGSDNTFTLVMTNNYNLTAVFTVEIPPAYFFEDGFESGFTAWTSTSRTSGETVATTTNPVYAGAYSAQFASNGQGGYERAYASESLTSTLNELYVQGYFRLEQNGIVDNNDRIKLVELRSGSTILAAAGLYQSGGTLRWWIETRNGANYVETYTSRVNIDLSQWFSLELKWTNNAASGGGSLWINGTPIYQISNADTDNYGGCSQVRLGLAETYNCGNMLLYSDAVKMSLTYIEP